MSFKKYRGPIETVEHAMMAHMVVTIECQRCPYWTTMYAWKLWHAKPWSRTLPLGKPVSGFRCRACRGRTQVVITPGMR